MLTKKGAEYMAELCCQQEYLDAMCTARKGLQLNNGAASKGAVFIAIMKKTNALKQMRIMMR